MSIAKMGRMGEGVGKYVWEVKYFIDYFKMYKHLNMTTQATESLLRSIL